MNPTENFQLCSSALRAISHGLGDLSNVPGLIKKIIKERAWERRQQPNGKVVELRSLAELITKPPMEGWGEDITKIKALLRGDREVEVLWDKEMQRQRGNPTGANQHNGGNLDNIKESAPTSGWPDGTSRDSALRRLRKDAPELLERVVAGELSPHAAMVKAGLRPRTFTIRADNVESAAKAIRKYFTDKQIAIWREQLKKRPSGSKRSRVK